MSHIYSKRRSCGGGGDISCVSFLISPPPQAGPHSERFFARTASYSKKSRIAFFQSFFSFEVNLILQSATQHTSRQLVGSTFTPVDGVQSRRFMKSIVVSLLQSTYRVRDVICEHSRKNSLVTAEIAVQICEKRAVLLASLQSEVQHFFSGRF